MKRKDYQCNFNKENIAKHLKQMDPKPINEINFKLKKIQRRNHE